MRKNKVSPIHESLSFFQLSKDVEAFTSTSGSAGSLWAIVEATTSDCELSDFIARHAPAEESEKTGPLGLTLQDKAQTHVGHHSEYRG